MFHTTRAIQLCKIIFRQLATSQLVGTQLWRHAVPAQVYMENGASGVEQLVVMLVMEAMGAKFACRFRGGHISFAAGLPDVGELSGQAVPAKFRMEQASGERPMIGDPYELEALCEPLLCCCKCPGCSGRTLLPLCVANLIQSFLLPIHSLRQLASKAARHPPFVSRCVALQAFPPLPAFAVLARTQE